MPKDKSDDKRMMSKKSRKYESMMFLLARALHVDV